MLTASLTALFYLYNIVFNTVFVFYTKYQFEDEKAGWERSKGKWHKYGMAMRVMAYAAVCGCFFITSYELERLVVVWRADHAALGYNDQRGSIGNGASLQRRHINFG